MKNLIFTALLIISFQGISQYAYKTGHTELVRRNDFMKLTGWNFGLGPTWMAGRFRNTRDVLYTQGDTSYVATHNPGGKIGIYAEVGRHHIFKYNKLFPYMDYGIHYKLMRGKEEYEGEWITKTQEAPFATTSGEGKFGHHHIGAHFNMNNVIQMSNKLFIQNTLGVNVGFSFLVFNTPPSGIYRNDQTLPRLWAQIHYKFGIGIKINNFFFIIPTIETPLVNFSPWTNFKLKMPHFMSEYRPLILTVRFAFLKQNNTSCPPVYDPANGGNDDPNYR